MIKLLLSTILSESGDFLIYNINDSYYINQAVDCWLTADKEAYPADEQDEKTTEERCIKDD